MVDTRSTTDSESDPKETTIYESLHQFSSAPTESPSEEKPETFQEKKMLESLQIMITDDIHFHLDYLNSSIEESEDGDTLHKTVEEIKVKQQKLDAVVSKLIFLIALSEQSNLYPEYSRLKIKSKKITIISKNISTGRQR